MRNFIPQGIRWRILDLGSRTHVEDLQLVGACACGVVIRVAWVASILASPVISHSRRSRTSGSVARIVGTSGGSYGDSSIGGVGGSSRSGNVGIGGSYGKIDGTSGTGIGGSGRKTGGTRKIVSQQLHRVPLWVYIPGKVQ